MKYFKLLFLLIFTSNINAQRINLDAIDSINLGSNIHKLAIDDLAQIYINKDNGSLYKYQRMSDSIRWYNNVLLGNPSSIDVSNANTLLLFYKDFGKIIILDNYLNEITTVNLFNLGHTNISSACFGADGSIWIFDEMQNNLEKLDKNFAVLFQTGDLRNVLGEAVFPSKIDEQNGMIYILDNSNIYQFDRFANYVNTFKTENAENIIQFDKGFLILKEKKLYWLDKITFLLNDLEINNEKSIDDFYFANDNLYFLIGNSLKVLNPEKLFLK